jgi:hypothetical protein
MPILLCLSSLAIAWQQLPAMRIPHLLCSAAFALTGWQLSAAATGQSVKLQLVLISTFLASNLIEINDQDVCSVLDMYVLEVGPPLQ